MNYGAKWSAAKKETTMTRNQSQVDAEKRYQLKRQGKPRIPCAYLTDEENQLLCDLAKIHGGKKTAIMAGLKMLRKQKSDHEEN